MYTRAAQALLVALAVASGATACRPADARNSGIDTAELSKREARLSTALGRTDSIQTDTSAGIVDSAISSDTVAAQPTIDDSVGADDEKGKNGKKKDKGNDVATNAARAGAIARWVLPRELDEISGVALTADGRLLAHGDELGQVSEIDYRRGVITKQFVVGRPTLRADLEGIAIVHGTIFLLTDKGVLYEFREGTNGARVEYITSDTRLGTECEFEGLAFDPTLNSLLLACKQIDKKDDRDNLRIYRWKIEGGGQRLSRLEVPLSKILPSINEKEFHPADITLDPKTGNYVIIASIEKALVEITPAGDVVFARKLVGEHDQPESIAITKDDILIIGDEAGGRRAVLTLYRWTR